MFQTWIPAPFGRLRSVDDSMLQCSSYLQSLMCLSGSCLQVYVVTLSKELIPILLPQHHQFKVFTNICFTHGPEPGQQCEHVCGQRWQLQVKDR